MTDKPDLSARRTSVKPAPDEDLDPITYSRTRQARAGEQKPMNIQFDADVWEAVDFLKWKTKKTKRDIVQEAIMAHWADELAER